MNTHQKEEPSITIKEEVVQSSNGGEPVTIVTIEEEEEEEPGSHVEESIALHAQEPPRSLHTALAQAILFTQGEGSRNENFVEEDTSKPTEEQSLS